MTIKLPLTTPTYDELREMTPEERFGQISLALRALSQFQWDYPNAPTPYHALKFVQWDVPQVQQLISRVVSLAELEFQLNGTRPPAVDNSRLGVSLGGGTPVGPHLSEQALSYFGPSGRVNEAPRPSPQRATPYTPTTEYIQTLATAPTRPLPRPMEETRELRGINQMTLAEAEAAIRRTLEESERNLRQNIVQNAMYNSEDLHAFVNDVNQEVNARRERALLNAASGNPNPELYTWTSIRAAGAVYDHATQIAPPRPPRGYGSEGT